MSEFRLTQHTYQRLTQSGSIRDDSNASTFPRFVSETNQVVTEFDYRQSLHMECGVVALEPPPPYTMKEIPHCMDRGDTERANGERGANEPNSYTPMTSPVNRESPPPYEERERMGANGGSSEERRRKSELVLLTSTPLNAGHSATGTRI